MAVESDKVVADVVEISEFPDLAERYAVAGVPKVVLNDQMELLGAQPEHTLLNAVLQMGGGIGQPS
jgi:predicted DsbA family dithiol-disulfide isomerase